MPDTHSYYLFLFLASLHTSGGDFNIWECLCLPSLVSVSVSLSLSCLWPIIHLIDCVRPQLSLALLNGNDCLEHQKTPNCLQPTACLAQTRCSRPSIRSPEDFLSFASSPLFCLTMPSSICPMSRHIQSVQYCHFITFQPRLRRELLPCIQVVIR